MTMQSAETNPNTRNIIYLSLLIIQMQSLEVKVLESYLKKGNLKDLKRKRHKHKLASFTITKS